MLIVDDEHDAREALGSTLEANGYGWYGAEHGGEALAYLRDGRHADLILIDLMMPVMDGWALLAELRKDHVLGRIPVLVISAGGPRALATLPGYLPRLAKPMDVEELLERVADAVGPGSSSSRCSRQTL